VPKREISVPPAEAAVRARKRHGEGTDGRAGHGCASVGLLPMRQSSRTEPPRQAATVRAAEDHDGSPRSPRTELWNEPLCSRACARELRLAVRARSRACLVCGVPLHPARRADIRFCSPRCRQRAFRYMSAKRRFEHMRELVADDLREIKEAWRRARRADPSGYTRTPLADQIRQEQRRILAMFAGRDHRACGQCGDRLEMRRGQKYCSTRCRVAAHRERASRPFQERPLSES
jgi:predicted nucleic acid-binding Zn ribbon protein